MMLNDLVLNREKKSGLSGEKGFTLVEVIVVLLIMGILLAYVFFGSMNNNNLQTEVDVFKSHLRYAQYIALCGDNTYTWRIDARADSYTFSRVSAAGASVNMSLPGEIFDTHTFAAGVTLAPVRTIDFNQWGSPGGSNITMTLSQGGVSANIIVTSYTGFVK